MGYGGMSDMAIPDEGPESSESEMAAWAQGYETAQREAQDAVAKMPLDSFWDGGKQAALIFMDGWRTGYDVAMRNNVRAGQ